MDRRSFIPFCCQFAAIALTIGCNRRFRSTYDKQPKRSLLEDRWPGYYFDQVRASYYLPLYSPAPDLRRDFEKSIPIISNNPNAPKSVPSVGVTPPTHATVELDYLVAPENLARGSLNVTLHWPAPRKSIASGKREVTESRVIGIDSDQLRRFLEESGKFRVDDDEHFFRSEKEGIQHQEVEHPVFVKIEIEGPNPDAKVSKRFEYQEKAYLYELVDAAWPGAQ